jgi:hypothetical protein
MSFVGHRFSLAKFIIIPSIVNIMGGFGRPGHVSKYIVFSLTSQLSQERARESKREQERARESKREQERARESKREQERAREGKREQE